MQEGSVCETLPIYTQTLPLQVYCMRSHMTLTQIAHCLGFTNRLLFRLLCPLKPMIPQKCENVTTWLATTWYHRHSSVETPKHPQTAWRNTAPLIERMTLFKATQLNLRGEFGLCNNPTVAAQYGCFPDTIVTTTPVLCCLGKESLTVWHASSIELQQRCKFS